MAVLLSGGVDSSLALRLLVAAGHRCQAFYLQIWFQVCVRARARVCVYKWVVVGGARTHVQASVLTHTYTRVRTTSPLPPTTTTT